MTSTRDENLARIVDSAIADGVVSAAIFTRPAGDPTLRLAAAAGIDGVPLQRLEDAVRNPDHPIARTLAEATATFDVRPMAPGGPALRSHLPIFDADRRTDGPIGVLAVAHEEPLDEAARARLMLLAESAEAWPTSAG